MYIMIIINWYTGMDPPLIQLCSTVADAVYVNRNK